MSALIRRLAREREFECCEECESPEDCCYKETCSEQGPDKIGFRFTQEDEDRHNDPRRR